MFNGYEDIFNQRGASYHAAMTQWPRARDEEFAAILAEAEIRDGDVVVDVPSGGGYLDARILQDVSMICIETSKAFSDSVSPSARVTKRLCALNETGIPRESVDRVICLAGLHHVQEKSAFFDEMFRAMKVGGRFCIADGAAGSMTSRFLDEFVHGHNSMGHRGEYLSAITVEALRASGFARIREQTKRYHWQFSSMDEMCMFCALLFGIDRGSPTEVLEGIHDYLGFETTASGAIRMNWELHFITCEK